MALINPSQTPEVFLKAVQKGGALRTQGIQDLSKSVQDHAAALKVEQSRVITLHGAKSHQAILTNERLIQQSALSEAVAGELQQSQVRVPQPSSNEFIVYGRVLDSTGHALKGMEVSATDPSGSILVNALSDSNGRFELHVAAASSAPAAAGEAAPVISPRKKRSPRKRPPTFQLVVVDKKRATILRSPEILTATAGKMANREVKMPVQKSK
jgi:hypothetical protein